MYTQTFSATLHYFAFIIHAQTNKWTLTKVVLLYMSSILTTCMFRSLLWPSSGCSTVQIPGLLQKSEKMHNKNFPKILSAIKAAQHLWKHNHTLPIFCHILKNKRSYAALIMTLGNFLCILYNFCCTPAIYTVELPEYNHNSDLNMQVLRTEDKIYTAEQLHKCAFIG